VGNADVGCGSVIDVKLELSMGRNDVTNVGDWRISKSWLLIPFENMRVRGLSLKRVYRLFRKISVHLIFDQIVNHSL